MSRNAYPVTIVPEIGSEWLRWRLNNFNPTEQAVIVMDVDETAGVAYLNDGSATYLWAFGSSLRRMEDMIDMNAQMDMARAEKLQARDGRQRSRGKRRR